MTIANDPTAPTQDGADFTIANAASLPTTLAPGLSATIQLQYTATIVGLQYAQLQVASNDPVTPTLTVSLRGIGTAGQFGTKEPSLVQVLRANNIPTIVGAGLNDVDINNPTYPETPDASSQEVPMQRLIVAGPGPVTITPLASFDTATQPAVKFGYYTPGDPTTSTELFTIGSGDAQTVNPTALGSTSFYPGSAPFSLYSVFPGTSTPNGSLDVHYSEDSFNTLDPAHPRKFRFFPLETASGTVVANAFVLAVEDYNGPQYNSFINFLGIIRNVAAAPNAAGAPVIGIQNLDVVPSDKQMVFNRIQIPNGTVADIVHDTSTLRINNSGDQPLVINSLTLSDTNNWTLVNPPAAGTSIAPGGSLTVTVQFIAQTDPPHTDNQLNNLTPTNGVTPQQAGGVWTATLLISTNDPINPTQTMNLAGFWQYQSEHENEPGLQTIVNRIYGYDTVISNTFQPDYPNGTTPTYYGEEVKNGLWNLADPNKPVSVRQLAAWHSQYDITMTPPVASTAFFGWYLQGNSAHTKYIFSDHVNAGQSLLPPTPTNTPTMGTFAPTGTFGLNLYGEKSEDALNTIDITTYKRTGHSVRTWPLRDSSGNIVPNTWIVSLDYQDTTFSNSDYQDVVYLVSNMTPANKPATPTDFQASGGTAGVNLQWSPVNGATGYNVYRSSNGSAFVKVNTTAIMGGSFVDAAAPSGTNISYQVTALNASRVESLPANSSTSLVGATNGVSGPTQTPPAAPADLQGDGSSGTAVNLSWTASTGAVSYILQRQGPGDSAFTQIGGSMTLTGTTFSDTNVTAGATYMYRVQAQNLAGLSPFSSTVTVAVTVPLVAPAAPTNLAADVSSGTQIVLTWTAPTGVSDYRVERLDPGAASFAQIGSVVTAPTFTDTTAVVGEAYQYHVIAENSAGVSPASAAITAMLAKQVVPPPPATLDITVGKGANKLVRFTDANGTITTIQLNGPGTATVHFSADTDRADDRQNGRDRQRNQRDDHRHLHDRHQTRQHTKDHH